MAIFYICRHGESENNERRRLSGWIDTPLTPAGEQNAANIAVKLGGLRIDKIISSDLGRAFTTAYIIAQRLSYRDRIERFKELREVNYGDLANQPYHDYPDLTPEENSNYLPPNGESLVQMQHRVLECLISLDKKYPEETVLIVAHDGTINALRAKCTGGSMGYADLTHNSHEFVAKFEIENGKITTFAKV